MLVYCYTRHRLGPIKTPYATPFELARVSQHPPSESKIYVISRHYLKYILRALGDEQAKLVQLTQLERASLHERPDYPIDFKNRGFSSVGKLRQFVAQGRKHKNVVRIAIMNGMGNGLGDNLIGLASLQHLARLLTPHRVEFHLLQELNYRTAFLYQYQSNILLRHSLMPLDEFLTMDFVIDLSDAANLPSLDQVSAASYNAHAFSINHLVRGEDLQARLSVDNNKVAVIRGLMEVRFQQAKPMVLLHPKASTALRTMPPEIAGALTHALIAQGFNVVSAFKYESEPLGFADVSILSRNADDLLHIVAAVDAVISVGTVVYHMAASLQKPTLLLATALPDVRSAQLMRGVITYLPSAATEFVQNKHKAEDFESLQIAQKFWAAVDVQDLAATLRQHMHDSSKGFTHEPA